MLVKWTSFSREMLTVGVLSCVSTSNLIYNHSTLQLCSLQSMIVIRPVAYNTTLTFKQVKKHCYLLYSPGLGLEGDVVPVKKRIARNVLFPAKAAIYKNDENMQKYEDIRKVCVASGINNRWIMI